MIFKFHTVQATEYCQSYLLLGVHTEYIGNIPVEKRDEVIRQLNQESARLIQVINIHDIVLCSALMLFISTTWNTIKLYMI